MVTPTCLNTVHEMDKSQSNCRNTEKLLGLDNQMLLNDLKDSLQNRVDAVMGEVRSQMMTMKESCLSRVDELLSNQHSSQNDTSKRCSKFPGKQFEARSSLLTELFRVSHIRTIYHIFIALLFLLFLQVLVSDLIEHGRVNIGFDLIVFAFGRVRETLELWLCMFLSVVLLLYPVFHYWAHHRHLSPMVMDVAFGLFMVVYLVVMMVLPPTKAIEYDIPPASCAAVILEQIRLLMKVYGFVRSNVPRVRRSDSSSGLHCPDFNRFIFYLFVPTLVYRDNYPRTSQIRWHYVVIHLVQLLCTILFFNFLLQRYILVPFRKMGEEPLTANQLLVHLFSIVVPSIICYLSAFFGLLHGWLNAFAEITRFADRLFYRDWWNSTNFASFYRNWNVVVHDWLYEYIYLDLRPIYSKKVAALAVFAVSSVVHEYALMVVFRFFFPLLFIQFGLFGTWIYFLDVRSAVGNVLLWMCLSFGVAMDFCFYSAEWFSRVNCPSVHEDVFMNFLTSRAWSCMLNNATSISSI